MPYGLLDISVLHWLIFVHIKYIQKRNKGKVN